MLKALLFQTPGIYSIARVLLGCVFLVAGAAKLMAPRAFARVISGYNLLPEELLAPVALGLPAIEFLAGLGLILNVRGSLKVIAGLLALFLVILGYAISNNLEVDCGCFSPEEISAQNNLRLAVLKDIGLLAVCFYLLTWRRFNRRLQAKYTLRVD